MLLDYKMSEYKSFSHNLKLTSGNSLVLTTTFLLTVFVNLTMAVQIGLLLAGISFIKRMSDALDVEEVIPVMTKRNGLTSSEEYDTTCPQLSFYTIDGPLFFRSEERRVGRH